LAEALFTPGIKAIVGKVVTVVVGDGVVAARFTQPDVIVRIPSNNITITTIICMCFIV
jgi:hypothetical protein